MHVALIGKRCTKLLLVFITAVISSVLLASCGRHCSGGQDQGCGFEVYKVGGKVIGLSGVDMGLVLQNNYSYNSDKRVDEQSIWADGDFTFLAITYPDHSSYSVTVKQQPLGQTCLVTNGTGTINGADVTNITVNCGS